MVAYRDAIRVMPGDRDSQPHFVGKAAAGRNRNRHGDAERVDRGRCNDDEAMPPLHLAAGHGIGINPETSPGCGCLPRVVKLARQDRPREPRRFR